MCGLALVFFSFTLFTAGCGSGVSASTVSKHEVAVKGLAMMGYSIQIGAFSKLGNAVRATENLQKMGLDAYYFIHKAGLYKVRFGDFPTRSKALKEAEKLRSSRMIDVYYLPLVVIRQHAQHFCMNHASRKKQALHDDYNS